MRDKTPFFVMLGLLSFSLGLAAGLVFLTRSDNGSRSSLAASTSTGRAGLRLPTPRFSRAAAPTVTVGQTLTAGVAPVAIPVTKPSLAAPAPTSGFGVRAVMKGCGQSITATIHVNKWLLLVNGGTLPRYPLRPPPVPLPGGAWVPWDWHTMTFKVPGAYMMSWRTTYCTLPAPRLYLKVVN